MCDIIIVNHNAGPFLAECILSPLPLTIKSVIIVDNASTDDSLSLAEKSSGDVAHVTIRNSKNLGFAAACNIGLRVASAQHLLFLNPDCRLEPFAVQRLIKVLESAPDVGMVGGLLSNPDGSEQRGGRRHFPTPYRALVGAFSLSFLIRVLPKYFSGVSLHKEALPSRPVAVDAISGACMLVKREAIEDVGLWDEGYFLHCEDLDWCMRFRQKGWKIMFVPDAKVIHHKGACSKSRPIFVEWHKHKGMMRFYRKFFRDQYPGVLMWLVAVGVWSRFSVLAAYYGMRHLGRRMGFVRE